MDRADFRLPAEWEKQSATLLAWPHAASDWAPVLPAVQAEYAALIRAITRRQSAVLLVPPGNRDARDQLGEQTGLHYIELRYNDTWTRDYGPVVLVHAGARLALDFYFNGWGGKHPAALDNRVNTVLARHELFNRLTFRQYLFELEGGAIDSDGRGLLLVNWHCLHARHPHLARKEIDHELHSLLNADKVLGIDLGPMPGDDTDGHIDTLARFISHDRIVFQSQRDAARNAALVAQLEELRDLAERNIELIALPVPDDLDPGLPASYANFLFINDALLVPTFGSSADDAALAILGEAVPGRCVEAVPAATLLGQGGGPHCATMHIPAFLG